MAKIHNNEPKHRAAIDELLPRVQAAFTDPSFWEPFVGDADAAGIPRLSSWLDGTGRVVAEQFRRRGLRSMRPADMPLTTSPMDGLLTPIRDALDPRRYAPKEPRTHQPAADARAPARQPPGRPHRLRQDDPRVAGDQRRSPARPPPPRRHRPRRPALTAPTRMPRSMRRGGAASPISRGGPRASSSSRAAIRCGLQG
jgi:hypothetical protein